MKAQLQSQRPATHGGPQAQDSAPTRSNSSGGLAAGIHTSSRALQEKARIRQMHGSPRVSAQFRRAANLLALAPAPDSQAPAVATAPIQLLRLGPAFTAGIGRQGGNFETEPQLATIRDALEAYQLDRDQFETDQAFSDHRASALDRAEHGVYAYLGAMGDLQNGGTRRDYMLNLMDEIQEAHRDHVDYVHTHNLRLFSAEDLDEGQRGRLDDAWNEVRGGLGAIRFEQGEAHEGDNREIRANFARLMSRRHGRELVEELRQQPDGEEAEPYYINVNPTERLSEEEQVQREANRRAFAGVRTRYMEIMAATNNGQIATEEQQEEIDRRHQAMMPFLDESRADFRSQDADEPAAASQAPHGTNLRVLRGLRDSENLNHAGVNTDLVVAPAHIVLGHELVHALHDKRNERDPGNPDDYAHGTPLAHWGNLEEQRTISTGVGPTENRLRADHGLRAREGHTAKSRRELNAEAQGHGLWTGLMAGLGALALGGLGYAAWRHFRS